ncbi:MAG: hypothetical protein LBK06_06295 [Planctomycetaceae bacterium]|jgi:hypothetical protein|nr:hypothetical protein [Planctomycetaceae bacterium]
MKTNKEQFIVNEINFSGDVNLSNVSILTDVKIGKGGGGGAGYIGLIIAFSVVILLTFLSSILFVFLVLRLLNVRWLLRLLIS